MDDEMVRRRRDEAEAALVAATGGGSLCRVGDGPEARAVKWAEGRVAALGDLQRARRRDPSTPLAAAARAALDRWRADEVANADRGPLWASYTSGGAAELADLVGELGDDGRPGSGTAPGAGPG